MDQERKFQTSRIDNNEKQKFIGGINMMIAMLEKANLAGSFTLKESAETVQAIGLVTQFINGPLQHA